ncbi:MAG: LysR family transcriptional regulator [Gammaproteobacteria bacterium]
MRLKGLDLNLLVALDVLLDECSVSRAAERLHVSQPAASAALGRLRDYFKDPILVLHGKRMIPTSYAEKLVPEVRAILSKVDSMISMSAEFDPTKSVRNFKINATDYITTVLIIPFAKKLEQTAPNIRLNIRLPADMLMAEFERGEVDLVLLPEEFIKPRHPAELVFEEPHMVVGWRDNPIFDETITPEAFFAADHVGVRIGPNSELTFSERHLTALGASRKMAIVAPNFSVVPWFLVGTRRLAIMQSRMARAFCSVMPLKTAPLPFSQPAMRLMAQYHTARTEDPSVRWLLESLCAAVDDIDSANILDILGG